MPPEASSNIDPSTGASPTADTRQDIWSLSPEQAGAALEAKAAAFRPAPAPLAPSNAREASQRLAQLINDVEWARKLMDGDITTRDEFQRLSELKASGDIGDAMDEAFETTVGPGLDGPSLSRRHLISVAEDMRAESVFNEEGIAFILSDQKFPTEDVRVAQYYLGLMQRDETLLYPELPGDRERQLKFLRGIVSIGDGSMP
jgi:hypothetical protein